MADGEEHQRRKLTPRKRVIKIAEAEGSSSSSRGKKPYKAVQIARASNAVVNAYKCEECDRSFSSGQALGGHTRTHRYKCNTCNATFPSAQARDDHVSSQHPNLSDDAQHQDPANN